MKRILLIALFLAGARSAADTGPMTDVQVTRLQELVHSTQAHDTRLRSRLIERQRALTAKYAHFELDEPGVEELQGEIVELQQELLANYHHMQVELRSLVGRERFTTLQRRIQGAFDKAARNSDRSAPANSSRPAARGR